MSDVLFTVSQNLKTTSKKIMLKGKKFIVANVSIFVVAQCRDQLLPLPDVRSSNLVIGQILYTIIFCKLFKRRK